jgi:hypothetical protein
MPQVDDVLEHFGIKGMHWGVRKARKEPITPVTTASGAAPLAYRKGAKTGTAEPIVIEARPGQAIRTSGGKGHSVKDEAIVSAALRQRAKNSGLQSLSNQDIRQVVDRMNLEMAYRKLNPKKLSFGQKATQELLYGSTPNLALQATKPLLAQRILKEIGPDPKNPLHSRTQTGLKVAEAIISARPKKPTKK